MKRAILDIKKRGRPKTDTTAIMLRVPPSMLAAIDMFVDDDAGISRPQAVRLILRKWLVENGALPAQD
jgi:metal-responsive CopG/Arc/MetJ family transcriptional regulator